MKSPQVTRVKSTLHAKTPLSLEISVEGSTIRSLSDCKSEDGNALTSVRLLTLKSGSLTNARPRHLKREAQNTCTSRKRNSYHGNQVRSFSQSSSVSHDSPTTMFQMEHILGSSSRLYKFYF